jgi:hypothetical protein
VEGVFTSLATTVLPRSFMITEPPTPSAQKAATNSTQSKNMGETTLKDAPALTGALPKHTTPLTFHFIKSSDFRVIHASGVWYGADPQQNLRLTFYNERQPLPDKVVININEQGLMVNEDESKREIRDGIVREMEVDIVLSMAAAVDFYKSFGENLKAMKAI